jgi:hypothetical protein
MEEPVRDNLDAATSIIDQIASDKGRFSREPVATFPLRNEQAPL